MKKIIFTLLISMMIFPALRVFAQTATNSDFNPFPQMEQDQNSVDQDTAPQPDQQNDDWPPANSEAQTNSAGAQ